MPNKPDVGLVLDGDITAVEMQPGVWNIFTPWRTGALFGLVLKGERDQVMEHFHRGLRELYVRELRYWAQNTVAERQPEGGPRM